MTGRAHIGSLSTGNGTVRGTSSGGQEPANAAGGVLDAPAVRPRYWVAVVGFVLVMLGAAEIFFRTNLLWQLPLEYLLQHQSDRHTRAAWLVHNPPAADEDEILVLGSSTAAAVIEPTLYEYQWILRRAVALPRLRLIALTDTGGCYAEHLTLLENAIDHGHRPAVVALISFPTCLRDHDDTTALLATYIPLVSPALAGLDDRSRPLDVRIRSGLVRASAVHRYRHAVNAWLRERWKGFLLGHAPWEAIAWAGDHRLGVWRGALEADRGRYERLREVQGNLSPAGSSARQLGAILDLARRHGARTLVIESPWAPPFFDVLEGDNELYHQAMQTIAARHGASYVDPNSSVRLPPESFEDLFHVNLEGARAYMPPVVSVLRQLTESE